MSGRLQIDHMTGRVAGTTVWHAHSVPQSDNALRVRQEVVSRLRLAVATGDYDPPVDELVNRLVGLILARQAGRRPEAGR